MPVQRPKSMLDPDAMASLERYLDYLTKERQVSAHTIAAYQRDLFSLSEFLTELGIRDWQDVQVQHARAFPARLKRAGQAGSSIQRSLSAARSLFRYLAVHQLVASNPFEAVSAPKSGKKLPATLSVDELSELLDQHDDSPSGLRDRAVLELFLFFRPASGRTTGIGFRRRGFWSAGSASSRQGQQGADSAGWQQGN